jgi:hypothetical protein
VAKKPLSQAEVFGLLRSVGVGKQKARILTPIAKRESGGRYWINNAGLNSNGTVDHGLFQINDVWARDPDIQKIGWKNRYDPVANAEMAKVILDKQGLKAWSLHSGQDAKYIGPQAKGYQGGPANPVKDALRRRVGMPTQLDQAAAQEQLMSLMQARPAQVETPRLSFSDRDVQEMLRQRRLRG